MVRKIIIEFVGLRAKVYNYFIDDVSEDNKAKWPKDCVINRKIKCEIYKNCLRAIQLHNKIYYLKKVKLT